MVNPAKSFIQRFALKIIFQLITIWISYSAIVDMQSFPANSAKWKMIFYLLSAGIGLLNVLVFSQLFTTFGKHYFSFPGRLPVPVKIVLVVILNTLPGIFLLYTEWGGYFTGSYLRLLIYLMVSGVTALLFFKRDNIWQTAQGLLLSLGISAFAYTIIINLAGVSTSPFSLGWSEGNRFYDYSLTFGKDLYNYTGDLRVPYNTPGRYALWGSLFLIPGLPIWVHRLWDALLWGISPLLLTVLMTRKIQRPLLRWGVIFWGALFIMQGPVYPHLLVPMILLSIFIWSDKLWVKVAAGAVISYYAGISRFTWAVLPGVWLVLFDLLFDYPNRTGSWKNKLGPPILLGLAGILPGVLGTWGGVINPNQSFATTQPLLLNRLWPNSTYGEGILLGFIIMALPLIVFLFWLIHARLWKVNKLAIAAAIVSLGGFMVLGLVASTKIGGGSNLHNLDMFILTLLFLAVIAISQIRLKPDFTLPGIHQWIIPFMVFVMVFPGWIAYRSGSPVKRLKPDVENRSLSTIKQEVENAKSNGEVLFIDQRQLLTFGYIKNVPLVPDYEKKYMMDQAMGNNEQYFNEFYKDLIEKRFSIIISDVLKTQYQQQDEAFSEENNAYVKWVSRQVLKYYEPIVTIKPLGIELLIPKP